jgi:hypothetical protein
MSEHLGDWEHRSAAAAPEHHAAAVRALTLGDAVAIDFGPARPRSCRERYAVARALGCRPATADVPARANRLTPSPVSVFEGHSMSANKETAMLSKSTNTHRRRRATVRRVVSTGVATNLQTAVARLDPSGSAVRHEHTPLERECMRIQQERIAEWRSGALRAKVVELPRHSSENGWSYDRAA